MRNFIFLLSLFFVFPTVGAMDNVPGPVSMAKTTITIAYPSAGTVWNAPDTVQLKWDTQNIPEHKSLKFYLVKDDMVLQELGVFQNKKFAENVVLDASLQAGDNYRVIALELFPDDKNSIAKYATPFFTIKKAPRKVVEKKEVDRPVAMTRPTTTAQPMVVRDMFDGRKLSYVNELEVEGTHIEIYIWDHGRKDGDIVSIYLNGEAVVSKYTLEYHKKKFEVQLDPSKSNDLFLYAHNLGKFPPNTVAIEIKDGISSENIVLNSDLKSCEAILINVKK